MRSNLSFYAWLAPSILTCQSDFDCHGCVLALTKLNYNACIYGDGQPVALSFADAVGEIVTAVSSPAHRCPSSSLSESRQRGDSRQSSCLGRTSSPFRGLPPPTTAAAFGFWSTGGGTGPSQR